MSELEVGQTVRIDVAENADYGSDGRQQLPVEPGTMGAVTGIREMSDGCDIQVDHDAYFYRDELTLLLSREEIEQQRDDLLAVCERAEQLAEIAWDWNLGTDGKVEIDGEWVNILDLRDGFRAAITKARDTDGN